MNTNSGALSFDVVINTNDFKRAMREMQQSVVDLTRKADKEVNELENSFSNLGKIAAGAFAFNELSQLAQKVVTVRGEFQQLEISFTTMLKSKAKADQLMSEVVQLAATTPFGLKDAAAATKQLLAYGSASTEVIGELRMLGDVAAGVSAPIGDLAYLYGTLRTQGKAMTVDIRQFAGRGIPIYEELAKVLKINTEEVAAFVSEGKVGFKDVQQAFKNMSGEGGTFQNLMAEQSKSLTGLTSQFADAVDIMFNDIGRSQEGALAEIIKGGTAVVENYKSILDILTVLIATYGAYKAVIIATSVIQSAAVILGNARAWLQLAATIKTAKDAQILFNLASSANPYALAIAAIAALATVYLVYAKDVSEAEKAQNLLAAAQKKAQESASGEIAKIEVLKLAIKNENLSRDERNKKLQELIALSPKHLEALTLDNIATNQGTDAINAYVAAMQRQIEIEEIQVGLKEAIQKKNDAKANKNQLSYFDQVLVAAGASGNPYDPNAGKNFQNSKQKETQSLNQQIEKQQDEIIEKYKTRITLLNDIGATADKSGKDETKAVVKNTAYYDEQIESLKKAQELKATDRKTFDSYQKQIDALEKAKDRITGGKTKKVAEKDLPQPLGSLAYYEQVARKAEEAMSKTPSDNFGRLKALNNIKVQAEAEAEKIRSQFAIKTFEQELQEKKIAYENYQKWITAFDDKVADQSFEQLTSKGKSYSEYLAGEIKRLEEQGKIPGIGLDGLERDKLVKLKIEYDEVTGAETPLQKFQTKLESIRDTATSLTDEIQRLKEIQTTLPTDDSESSRSMRQQTKQQIIEASRERERALTSYLQSIVNSEESRLAIENRYKDLRVELEKRYGQEKGAAYQNALNNINKAEEKEYQEERNKFAQEGAEWKALTKVIQDSTNDQTRIRVNALRGQVELMKAYGLQETEDYKAKLRELKDAEENHKQQSIKRWGQIADVVGQLGELLQDMPGAASEIGGALSGLAGQFGNISKALNSISTDANGKTSVSGDGYVAAAQSVISMITTIVQSNKKRHEDEKAFAVARIGYENEYQLALNRSIGESYKKNDNIFVKDVEAKIKAGAAQYQDAQQRFQDAIEKLNEGRAKVRQKDVVDGKSVGQLAGSGLVLGAVIGSAAGPVGTAVGAVVGAAAGAIIGLFATKKKKDVFGSLLEEYPDLIEQGADGWKKLDIAMAQSLVTNGQVDDKTKELLKTAIAYNEELEKSSAQIEEGLSDLVGSLGDNIRNALVTAFQDGTDAAQAFGKAVGDVIADMASKLLFVALFKEAFDKLQTDMKASYGLGGDQTIVDDLGRFFVENGDKPNQYAEGLEAINKAMEAYGFSNIMGKKSGTGATGLRSAIAGITEETAGLLAGQFNAIRIHSADTNRVVKEQLVQLIQISANTSYNKNLVVLFDIVDELKNLNQTSIRGFGL